MSMKERALRGLSWSFVDNIGNRLIQFAVGIVMARLLTPREYGLLGMVTIFVGISNVFIDSGFSQALIIRKDCRREDYSTVFFFNLAISALVYAAVVMAAPSVSRFFREPELVPLLRVYGVTLIVGALALVQRVEFSKRIDFKTQTKVTFTSTILSSVVGIILAWNGYGVWSLVVRLIVDSVLTTSLFWILGEFRLLPCFDWAAFRGMFSFGSRLLASSLLDRGYEEIYKVVIGRFFSVTELGHYTRATQFSEVPAIGFTQIVQRVSAPVLAQLEPERMKIAYRRIIITSTLIVFSIMIGLAACARNLVLVMLGEKWIMVVPYLQLLCLGTMLYPLHALNLEIVWVRGHAQKFLALEIVKKAIDLPVILVGIFFGIIPMLIGMAVASCIAFFVNSRYSGALVGYSSFEQVGDLVPNIAIAGAMGAATLLLGSILDLAPILELALQIAFGSVTTMILCELLRTEAYLEIRSIVLERIPRRASE